VQNLGADDTRYKRYSALDDDGICRVGEKLNDQSIMINREVPIEDRELPQSQSLQARGSKAQCLELSKNFQIS